MPSDEQIRILFVEDNQKTADAITDLINNLTYAHFSVDTVGKRADAISLLSTHDPGYYDLLLVDFELTDGTALDIFSYAKSVRSSAHFAVYSSHPTIPVPPQPEYTALLANMWSPKRLTEHIRGWFNARRRCALGAGSDCAWRRPPPEVVLPTVPFVYLSMPYDTNTPRRTEALAALFQKADLGFTVTLKSSYNDPIEHIIWGIRMSSIAVFDLQGDRPNVYIEAGIALALGKTMALFLPQGATIPFNLSHAKAFIYSPSVWADKTVNLEVDAWLSDVWLPAQRGV